MTLPSWLCSSSPKRMFVKIVFLGGRVELHDEPILASSVMRRYPSCCVAYPEVFRQPWAVAAPDTELVLGEKFFVVPISTLRKLRRHSRMKVGSPHPGAAARRRLLGERDHEEEAERPGLKPVNGCFMVWVGKSKGWVVGKGKAKARKKDGVAERWSRAPSSSSLSLQ